jgi:hypothetical protein
VTVLRLISGLLFLHAAGAGFIVAQSGTIAPTVQTIVTRMAQARAENRAHFRPYRVTRDYRLFGKELQKSKFEATAHVTFVPPDSKTYVIQRASGLRVGEKIVRQMLAGEAHIAKNYGSTDISAVNYDLRLIGEDYVGAQRCYVLELLPRRKDKNLLHGKIWVDATTYLLHRMEGEPAKAPSWFLRDASIKFVYGDVGGMWLQTASESTANVRLLGQYTMVSRDVGYQHHGTSVSAR